MFRAEARVIDGTERLLLQDSDALEIALARIIACLAREHTRPTVDATAEQEPNSDVAA